MGNVKISTEELLESEPKPIRWLKKTYVYHCLLKFLKYALSLEFFCLHGASNWVYN